MESDISLTEKKDFILSQIDKIGFLSNAQKQLFRESVLSMKNGEFEEFMAMVKDGSALRTTKDFEKLAQEYKKYNEETKEFIEKSREEIGNYIKKQAKDLKAQ
jgi:hypothetical protein